MRVFVNRDIKRLFLQIILCMAAVVLVSVLPVISGFGAAFFVCPDRGMENMTVVSEIFALLAPFCTVFTGGAALIFCYRYFRQQDRQMEEAVEQIRAFVSGDKDARIVCDEEGSFTGFFMRSILWRQS